MHTAVSLSAGARRARFSAVASRLPARSRARAAGDRSERRIAVLALRPACAEHLHTRLFRRVQRDSAPSSSAPTNPLQFWRTDGVPGINRRPFFNTVRRTAGTAQRSADACARRPERPVSQLPHAWRAIRTAARTRASAVRDLRVSLRLRRIRCSSCSTATWTGCGRSGSGSSAASIRRSAASYDSNPLNPPGHNLPDTMWPWNGVTGGHATAYGARRRHGELAHVPPRPGPQPRVQRLPRLPGNVRWREIAWASITTMCRSPERAR